MVGDAVRTFVRDMQVAVPGIEAGASVQGMRRYRMEPDSASVVFERMPDSASCDSPSRRKCKKHVLKMDGQEAEVFIRSAISPIWFRIVNKIP